MTAKRKQNPRGSRSVSVRARLKRSETPILLMIFSAVFEILPCTFLTTPGGTNFTVLPGSRLRVFRRIRVAGGVAAPSSSPHPVGKSANVQPANDTHLQGFQGSPWPIWTQDAVRQRCGTCADVDFASEDVSTAIASRAGSALAGLCGLRIRRVDPCAAAARRARAGTVRRHRTPSL